ncbi:MAG: adenosylcobinamide-GDP ribazoletransferase [Halovenus sp.]
MALSGLRGAVGFLTRVPVGHDEHCFRRFRTRPYLFPLVGYGIGFLVVFPFLLPVSGLTVAFLYVVSLFIVTGINHADGLADLGDAAVVHGDQAARQSAMRDTTTGVGATVALVVALVGLALAGVGLSTLPTRAAVGIVVAAEVAAKLAMAMLACLGAPSHEGLGSQLTGATVRDLPGVVLVAAPAAVLGWPELGAAVALGTGPVVAVSLLGWAQSRLGGVSGDVFGAGNELARLAALHTGVVAWTLS